MDERLVGILEQKSDRFIADVVSRLEGIPVEFMSVKEATLPLQFTYRVVVDRLSFRYPFLREIMKGLALSGTYVINNPFAASAANKSIEIEIGTYLGLTFPKTFVLPDQAAAAESDGLVANPNLQRVAEELGFPCILKPFDGYAWQDVHVVRSAEELQNLYLALSDRYVLLAQQFIRYSDYFRVFCFDKRDVLFVRWVPKPMAMGQYLYCDLSGMGETTDRVANLTIQINRALDFDINVTEWCIDEEGRWCVIETFNEVPEVIAEALPPDYYSWIVDKFAACVRDKLDPNKKNNTPFGQAT